MKFLTNNKYFFIGTALGAILVFLLAQVTTERKLNELQTSLESSIEASVASTTELAKIIGEGRLTKTAETIITDCDADERVQFEDRLARLDTGLSQAELAHVDRLFSRCAPVQSIRRTLMVMDFVRQVEGLDTLVTQRKQIGEYAQHDTYVADIKMLAEYEERITQLSLDLVYLQREIIDALLNGESVASDTATRLKERGYTLRIDLIEEAQDATALRARIFAS